MGQLFNPKLISVLKHGYTKKQFSKDLFAGVIVGIVALPLAIAFAVASGVSPEKGLITAVVAGLLISVLGGRLPVFCIFPDPYPLLFINTLYPFGEESADA